MRNVGLVGAVSLALGAVWACSGSSSDSSGGHSGGSANGGSANSGSAGAGAALGEAGVGAAGAAGSASKPDVKCAANDFQGCTCVADINHKYPDDAFQCASSDRAFCCADLHDYPNQGTCECSPWTCTANSTECACGPLNSGPLTTCPDNYTHCCKGTNTCDCSNGLAVCGVDQVLVPSCTLAAVECLPGEARVSACQGSPTAGTGGTAGSGGSASTEAGAGGISGAEAGAPGTSVTPDQLPGLALWLDASVGVTADSSHHVAAWTDRSAHHNDAAAVTALTQPLLVADIVNGLPVIHFDGLSSQATLQIPDSGSLRWGTGDFSLHVVAAYTNTTLATPRYGMLYGKFAVAAPYAGVILFANFPSNPLYTGVGVQLDSATQMLVSTGDGFNDGKARVYGVRRVGHEVIVQVNDADGGDVTWTLPDDVSAPGRPVYIGSQPGNQYLIGDIAEIVAVSGTLSAAEHAALTSYLMKKYQL